MLNSVIIETHHRGRSCGTNKQHLVMSVCHEDGVLIRIWMNRQNIYANSTTCWRPLTSSSSFEVLIGQIKASHRPHLWLHRRGNFFLIYFFKLQFVVTVDGIRVVRIDSLAEFLRLFLNLLAQKPQSIQSRSAL